MIIEFKEYCKAFELVEENNPAYFIFTKKEWSKEGKTYVSCLEVVYDTENDYGDGVYTFKSSPKNKDETLLEITASVGEEKQVYSETHLTDDIKRKPNQIFYDFFTKAMEETKREEIREIRLGFKQAFNEIYLENTVDYVY